MAQSLFRTVQRLLDDSGAVEPGATIEFYTAGTTTPLTVYSDRALSTTAGSSVTADANGAVAERWVADSVLFKLIYKDADGATKYTRDYANDDQTFSTDTEYDWSAIQNFDAGARFGDDDIYIVPSGVDKDVIFNFAPNDYLIYDRSANTLSLVIGSATVKTWAATSDTGGHLYLLADSTYDLGTTSVRARVAYLDDLELRPSASRTPAANGDLSIEATSNTTITLKLKGSDGTVRSGTVTLS